MGRRKTWLYSEKAILIDNYHIKTIKELEEMLPGRNADSINAEIKRLKTAGKIKGGKEEETIKRAYYQRQK
jgi:hypothetical protein